MNKKYLKIRLSQDPDILLTGWNQDVDELFNFYAYFVSF